ncbi:MAG: alanine--tRNA ligase-related protein [Caldisericia bacterium]
MKSHEIRESFLSFFSGNDHYVLEGASLIPSDPTVLFTLAGMLPLKPFFTGERTPISNRLTSCQRCFRTNDIENVGKTNFHHTLFEMLGNFSIGDYFKKEAIPWALEYLVKVVGIPKDRLIVTVYPDDDESVSIWKKMGIPEGKIIPEKSNFWTMGEVGPCGPDSEIHFDWEANTPFPMKDGEVDLTIHDLLSLECCFYSIQLKRWFTRTTSKEKY